MGKRKTSILILDRDDPERELNFELDFQLTLTEAERYEIMDQLVKDGIEFAENHGYKNTPAVVTRS